MMTYLRHLQDNRKRLRLLDGRPPGGGPGRRLQGHAQPHGQPQLQAYVQVLGDGVT